LLLEARPDVGVIKLDGWLTLADGDVGGARVWNLEDVRKFVQREDVEALCAENIMAHRSDIRTIRVYGELVCGERLPSLRCVCRGVGVVVGVSGGVWVCRLYGRVERACGESPKEAGGGEHSARK
jgi:hypothetical protein